MNSTLVTLVQVGLVSACVLNGFTLQVIMAVCILMLWFSWVRPCRLVYRYQHFRGASLLMFIVEE